jgi:hypothetical protein
LKLRFPVKFESHSLRHIFNGLARAPAVSPAVEGQSDQFGVGSAQLISDHISANIRPRAASVFAVRQSECRPRPAKLGSEQFCLADAQFSPFGWAEVGMSSAGACDP